MLSGILPSLSRGRQPTARDAFDPGKIGHGGHAIEAGGQHKSTHFSRLIEAMLQKKPPARREVRR